MALFTFFQVHEGVMGEEKFSWIFILTTKKLPFLPAVHPMRKLSLANKTSPRFCPEQLQSTPVFMQTKTCISEIINLQNDYV